MNKTQLFSFLYTPAAVAKRARRQYGIDVHTRWAPMMDVILASDPDAARRHGITDVTGSHPIVTVLDGDGKALLNKNGGERVAVAPGIKSVSAAWLADQDARLLADIAEGEKAHPVEIAAIRKRGAAAAISVRDQEKAAVEAAFGAFQLAEAEKAAELARVEAAKTAQAVAAMRAAKKATKKVAGPKPQPSLSNQGARGDPTADAVVEKEKVEAY